MLSVLHSISKALRRNTNSGEIQIGALFDDFSENLQIKIQRGPQSISSKTLKHEGLTAWPLGTHARFAFWITTSQVTQHWVLCSSCRRWHRPAHPHLHVLLHLRVVEAPPDEALGSIEGVVWVSDRLPLRRHAHQALAVCCEGDHRRRRPGTFRVLQHLGESHTRTPSKITASENTDWDRRLQLSFDLLWLVSLP